MALRVMVRFQAKPGEGEKLLELVRGMIPEARAIEGAGAFELVRGLEDPDLIISFARWRERSDHDTYMAWRASTGIGTQELAALIASPPEVLYLETVEEWGD